MSDVERVLDTGEGCEHEVYGHSAPFLMRILPYHDPGGQVQGVVLAFIEISRLKESGGRSSQHRLIAIGRLFDAAPCGFVKVDSEGTIVMSNNASAQMFGYDQR